MRTIHKKLAIFCISSIVLSLPLATTAYYRFSKRTTPGRLVAREQVLAWRSPANGSFRLLALDAAQATFHLDNFGGTPVRILDVRTTCGCTTPKIDPMVVAAGGTARMDVKATPIQTGEKYVDITLSTDSPSQPTVLVKLHIIGSRRAPYMLEARGDLNYSGDTDPKEPRSIVIDCIEPLGSRPTSPIIKNDLDFVEVSVPKMEKEGPTTTPEAVHRRYVVTATLKASKTSVDDSGRLIVVDPWDPEHFQEVHVHREAVLPVKVSPRRAILKAGLDENPREPSAKFVITTREPTPDLSVELSEKDDSPLVVSPLSRSDDNRTFVLSVRLKPGITSNSIQTLIIGKSASSERVEVPIAIRLGEAR